MKETETNAITFLAALQNSAALQQKATNVEKNGYKRYLTTFSLNKKVISNYPMYGKEPKNTYYNI